MTMTEILNRTVDQVVSLSSDPDECRIALQTAASALSWAWKKDAVKLYAYMAEERTCQLKAEILQDTRIQAENDAWNAYTEPSDETGSSQ